MNAVEYNKEYEGQYVLVKKQRGVWLIPYTCSQVARFADELFEIMCDVIPKSYTQHRITINLRKIGYSFYKNEHEVNIAVRYEVDMIDDILHEMTHCALLRSGSLHDHHNKMFGRYFPDIQKEYRKRHGIFRYLYFFAGTTYITRGK